MAGGFMPVSLELTSAPLTAALKRYGPLAGQEAAKALIPEGKSIVFGARQRIRNRTGQLGASVRYAIRAFPDAVRLRVMAGDKGISYAVAVHQKPGQPNFKYLANAVKAHAPGMEGRLAARLGKGLEGGAT